MSKPTIDEQIKSVAREIAIRKNVYPKWVASGRMKLNESEKEIKMMEAVLDTLKQHQSHQESAKPQ